MTVRNLKYARPTGAYFLRDYHEISVFLWYYASHIYKASRLPIVFYLRVYFADFSPRRETQMKFSRK